MRAYLFEAFDIRVLTYVCNSIINEPMGCIWRRLIESSDFVWQEVGFGQDRRFASASIG